MQQDEQLFVIVPRAPDQTGHETKPRFLPPSTDAILCVGCFCKKWKIPAIYPTQKKVRHIPLYLRKSVFPCFILKVPRESRNRQSHKIGWSPSPTREELYSSHCVVKRIRTQRLGYPWQSSSVDRAAWWIIPKFTVFFFFFVFWRTQKGKGGRQSKCSFTQNIASFEGPAGDCAVQI